MLHELSQIPTAARSNQAPLSSRGATDGVLSAIGKTPLVRLRRFLDRPDVDLYAKLEACNPGGSAKDRPAEAMIRLALEKGEIRRGTTVVESSSGNMGIGLAQACRYHGLRFVCVVDPRAQGQNVAIIRALGGEIELVEPAAGSDFLSARLERVRDLVSTIPDAYWPNQYANPANPLSHEQGTAAEIIESIGRPVDFVFVATSSTGTLSGCIRAFAAVSPSTQVIGVDAFGSVLFGGQRDERHISGFGAGCIPPLASECRPSEVYRATDLDCVVGCRRLAAKEAILAGGSGGGVLQSIRERQDTLSGLTCVAILHDSGTRYLETVYDDAWVSGTLGISRERLDCLIADREPVEVACR